MEKRSPELKSKLKQRPVEKKWRGSVKKLKSENSGEEMDGSGEEMDGREETFTGGTKLKQLAEAGEFKCGRFKFTFFFLTLFSVFRLKKRKKKRGRRKLNEGIFIISPLICPKCQLFYNQS